MAGTLNFNKNIILYSSFFVHFGVLAPSECGVGVPACRQAG